MNDDDINLSKPIAPDEMSNTMDASDKTPAALHAAAAAAWRARTVTDLDAARRLASCEPAADAPTHVRSSTDVVDALERGDA